MLQTATDTEPRATTVAERKDEQTIAAFVPLALKYFMVFQGYVTVKVL